MDKPKKSESKAASVAPQVKTEKEQKPITYVVVRDGFRVSEREYSTPTDPAALHEKGFWTTVEQKHSWGAPVDIVQYDPKRHRTW